MKATEGQQDTYTITFTQGELTVICDMYDHNGSPMFTGVGYTHREAFADLVKTLAP